MLRYAATLAVCALLAGCGGDAGTAQAGADRSPSPTAAVPHRIVSLSPTATETLYAVGAGDQVVAVDKNSDYPPAAPDTNPTAGDDPEGIAKFRPDLVVTADDSGDLEGQLAKLGIPVLVEPAARTLDDAYGQIRELGARTGHEGRAKRLVASMRKRIAELARGLPHRAEPLTYYHELDATLYTETSDTFIGQLYALAGLKNIADAAGHGNPYPQLSAEYVVKADPDLVFLADTECCGQTADTFAARPGFGRLKAVRTGQVIPLDDDVASRWGPRVVDFLRRIIAVVKTVPAR